MKLLKFPTADGRPPRIVRVVGASILILMFIGTVITLIVRGPYDRVNPPEVMRRIYGCYYLDGSLALELSPDGVAHSSGPPVRFSVVSIKRELKILPEGRLAVVAAPDGTRRVRLVEGLPLYLPLVLEPSPTVNLLTQDRASDIALAKATCHADRHVRFPTNADGALPA